MIKNPYRQLEAALGYRFRRRARLQAALTHPSFSHETAGEPADYQRYEFLGDAALGLAAAAHLFREFPEGQEGELTRLRSGLASARALAHFAAQVKLGEYLRLGRGESQSGGHRRESNLADAFEAVMGAAYEDGGFKAVEKIFKKVILAHHHPVPGPAPVDNPKGLLQEIAQRNRQAGPRYVTLAEEGPPHARHYTVEVLVGEQSMGRGEGSSKRSAEMRAAEAALALLRDTSD